MDGTTIDGRMLDRVLDRRYVAEEPHGVVHLELARERLQRRLQRPAAGDVERQAGHLLPRLREGAEQHDMALDRDQPADAEQPWQRLRVRRRLAARGDAVVDDLEVLGVEALRLLEVLREAARDGDVDVRETRNSAVGERERTSFAELVEAVLRRNAHGNARERARDLAVRVRVDEMGVQDRRALAADVVDEPHEGGGVEVPRDRDRVQRHAARLELAREVPRAGLVLVEHEHAHVPPALGKPRQQREQVRLRAGDAGDLLEVQDLRAVRAHRRAASRIRSAQC